jgi:predicted lipoprotein with Yx(FWY)xxD motif
MCDAHQRPTSLSPFTGGPHRFTILDKESRMRSSLKFLLPVVVTSLTLAACGSSSSKSSSQSTSAASESATSGETTVKSASNASLHSTVLVDSNGMTLYRLSGEENGKWICTTSPCTEIWHPLTATAGTPSGSVGSLATVKRPDGSEQVTYKGMPLYTFAKDRAPGEANGQGIKDVGTWTAVTVSGSSGTSTAPSSAPAESSSQSSGGGSKYGY